MTTDFQFSNAHHDLMARDEEVVLGWRYEPRIVFRSGRGVTITDVDGNDYFDMTSGMMCMVLGHSHPELSDEIKAQADLLVHQSSWYTNPWLIEFAELITSTLPEGLELVNFAVTGSEANEIAMRMALGATGKYDMVSLIRGLHGGSLAAEAMTSVGGARKAHLGEGTCGGLPLRAWWPWPQRIYPCDPVGVEAPERHAGDFLPGGRARG